MASAKVRERRSKVAELWLASASTLSIAKTLQVAERTVRQDIQVIRTELDKDRLAELEDRRVRSIAVLRRTQHAAWTTYNRVKPESVNATGALNVIHACEQSIAKLEGTWNADIQVNQTTNVGIISADHWHKIQLVISSALLNYPDARVKVAEALASLEEQHANVS